MKELHKEKVGSLLESSNKRLSIVLQMMNGESRPDNKSAKLYIETVLKNLENIQNYIDIAK